jgi:thiol-disulfide isomerase/thioredoxin
MSGMRKSSASAPFKVFALAVACALPLAACGEPPRYARSETPAASPAPPEAARTTSAPRTNMPMPPVATAHGSAAAAQSAGWTLLSGRRETLADYRGKVLVLDLYATYCPPCRDSIPHLISLQRRYGKEGLRVVGLNVGGPEDRQLVPEFVSLHGIQYDLGNPDDEFVSMISGGDTRIPRTYVFGRDGQLVESAVGYNEQIAALLEHAVQEAVGGDGAGE